MASNIQIVIYDFLPFLSLSFFRKLFFLYQSTQHCCRLERIQNVQIPDFNGRLKSAIQIHTEKRIRKISLQHTTRLKFRTIDKLISVYFSSFLLKNIKVYRQKKWKKKNHLECAYGYVIAYRDLPSIRLKWRAVKPCQTKWKLR